MGRQKGREKKDSFLHFCEAISSESLEIASVNKRFGVEGITKELSDHDKQKLVDLLETISENDLHLKKEVPAIKHIEVYLYLRTTSQEYALQYVREKGIFLLSAESNNQKYLFHTSKNLWLDSSSLEEYMISYF